MVIPLPHLTALLAQLDTLADDARRVGDEKQERYYYGVMFGLETARDRVAQLVADMMRESTHLPHSTPPAWHLAARLRMLSSMFCRLYNPAGNL